MRGSYRSSTNGSRCGSAVQETLAGSARRLVIRGSGSGQAAEGAAEGSTGVVSPLDEWHDLRRAQQHWNGEALRHGRGPRRDPELLHAHARSTVASARRRRSSWGRRFGLWPSKRPPPGLQTALLASRRQGHGPGVAQCLVWIGKSRPPPRTRRSWGSRRGRGQSAPTAGGRRGHRRPLALYRLAFGQPRREDMIAALQRGGIAAESEPIAELRIDLRPPAPHAIA